MYKAWGSSLYRANTHINQELPYDNNPQLGAELIRFLDILPKIGFYNSGLPNITMEGYEKVWLKLRPIFIEKALLPRVMKNAGKFPEETKTNAMKELLARGFVHGDEVPKDQINKGWIIECHIGQLLWPYGFLEQKDAIEIMDRFGIPGYNGVKQTKKS